MKMNSTQIDKTLHQLDGQAIPVEHPVMVQLERLFGEHTYFLDGRGLNIVEPVETERHEFGQRESRLDESTEPRLERRPCGGVVRQLPAAPPAYLRWRGALLYGAAALLHRHERRGGRR